MRKYFYLIIILFFNILFVLTLFVDFQGLFYTITEETPDIIRYNRIPVQAAIFVYGLTGIVSFYYLFETLFNQSKNIKIRIIKGFSLIVIVYLINWVLSLLVDSNGWTIYEHYRGAPATYYCFLTLFLTGIMFLIIEILNKNNGLGIVKRLLTRLVNKN